MMVKGETVGFLEFASWAMQNKEKWGLLRNVSCAHPAFGRAIVIQVGIRNGSANITIRTLKDHKDILLIANNELRELVFDRSDLVHVCRQAGYEMSAGKWQELLKRDIKHLCHFTPLQNVPSILKHGLLPRSSLGKIIPKPLLNDNERWEQQLGASCLSISFPNYKMFFGCRERHKDRQWAVLLISTDVLTTNVCGFYFSNASRSCFERVRPQLYQTMEAFRGLFAASVETGIRSSNIPSFYTTDPQAEVLIFGGIAPETILSIQVPTLHEVEKLTKLRIHNSIEVSNDYFVPRSDWKDW